MRCSCRPCCARPLPRLGGAFRPCRRGARTWFLFHRRRCCCGLEILSELTHRLFWHNLNSTNQKTPTVLALQIPNSGQEIILSGAQWTAPDDFYNALLSSLGAPGWHGHNLDALWDSITRGDINEVYSSFRVEIAGVDQMPLNCKALVDRFVDLISDARAEGVLVEIVCL